MPRLDDQNEVAREMRVVIEEMANLLEHFGADLQPQKMRLKKELMKSKSLLQP